MNYSETRKVGDIQGIYKITNMVNGKSYIGQSVNIKNRLREHVTSLQDYPLYHAFEKYSIDAFDFEILEIVKDRLNLNDREMFFINLYKSSIHENGYNIASYVDGSPKVSELSVNDDLRWKVYHDLKTYKDVNIVAEKYGYSVRSIYRFNAGDYPKLEGVSYPIFIKERKIKEKRKCSNCLNTISKNAINCEDCHRKLNYKNNITKEQLYETICYFKNFSYVGLLCGVSDNAVRKWCKSLGLPFKTKDYKLK